ncbi:hypothetical protein D4R99_00615 [bacterium]|nr:MAG: hypothetical protein D4R99_00615 [bacterium]
MNKSLTFEILLPVSIFREGKAFVAYSPALDLSTSGKTFEQTQKRFHEIVEIFFEELERKGTTDKVLEGLGWEKSVKSEWVPPTVISHNIMPFQMNYA